VKKVAERLAELERVGSFEPELRRQLLSKALHDRSPKIRGAAIEQLTAQVGRDILPLIETLVDDPNPMVRYDAVESIGQLLEGEALHHEGPLSRLADGNELVRVQTLESLAQIGDRSSLPRIAGLLTDESPLVRSYAASTIADLGGSEYLESLRDAHRAETDDLALVGIHWGLLQFGQRDSFGDLLELLSSSDYRVRCAVANSLEHLPMDQGQLKRAVSALLAARSTAIGRADRSTVERVLSSLKD